MMMNDDVNDDDDDDDDDDEWMCLEQIAWSKMCSKSEVLFYVPVLPIDCTMGYVLHVLESSTSEL